MSDLFKPAPEYARYDRDMVPERLLLLDRPVPRARSEAPRFQRSEAPFRAHIVPVLPELERDVAAVAVLEGCSSDPSRPPALDVLPGTRATLCITYGAPVQHAGRVAPSTLSGLFSTTRSYVPMPAIGVIMVAFRPGGLRRFIGTPVDELAETNVDAAAIWGGAVTTLEDRVASTRETASRGELVQRFLLERRAASGWDPTAARIASAIVEAGGDVSIRALAAEAAMSERQLERRFSTAVGVRPKRFARLARFARALSLAQSGLPWAQVAAAAGFSDQSHLTRELVALVGATPECFGRLASVSTSI